jgi:pimeloyl-ACP methyl ester carboxylesterase
MRKIFFPTRGKHYIRGLLLRFFIGLFIALFVIVPLVLTYFLSHPKRYPVCCFTPADLGLEYETITFPASDGVNLSGWYIPSQNGAAIVMVHANNGNRTGVIYHAQFLAEQGYGILMFDVRGFGESEGSLLPYPQGGLAEDVNGAVTYLQQRPEVNPDRIGALGLSMGAIIVLRAAAINPDIRAVVADGADEVLTSIDEVPELRTLPPPIKAYFQVVNSVALRLMGVTTAFPGPRISDGIAHIAPRPILLISAGTGKEQADNRLFYSLAGEPKTLWELPDVAHINAAFAQSDEYHSRVLTFFNEALLSQ